MEMPLVSTIIVTHNRKNLVIKAINSVLSQTYKNIEFLVIDDASTDGTKELLENRTTKEDFSYIYICPEESKGGNYARNLGIKLSKGKYIAFLDDDDEWFPEKTSKQVDYLEKNDNCGVVSCLNVLEYNFKNRYHEKRDAVREGDLHQLIFTCFPFVTSMAMFRRNVLIDAGMFDENLKYWQDAELNIRLAQKTVFGCVYEELSLYRVNNCDKNRLTNHLEGWIDAIDYIEKKHKHLIELLPEDLAKKHQWLIAQDGVTRAGRVSNAKIGKKYLRIILKCEPSLKNLILYLVPFTICILLRDIKEYLGYIY